MSLAPDDPGMGETPYGLDWMMRGAPQPRRLPSRPRPLNMPAIILAALIAWAAIALCAFLVWGQR